MPCRDEVRGLQDCAPWKFAGAAAELVAWETAGCGSEGEVAHKWCIVYTLALYLPHAEGSQKICEEGCVLK